jgi:hypothetical protein
MPLASEQGSVVVDRIVAVVGDRLVLSSDVVLEQTLLPLEGSSATEFMSPSTPPLQHVIDRTIIRGLAGNAAIYTPSDTDVQQRVSTVRAHFPEDNDWEEFLLLHGLDGDRLTSLLYSRLVVDRYIERNVPRVDGQSGRTTYGDWIRIHRARVPIRVVPLIESTESEP